MTAPHRYTTNPPFTKEDEEHFREQQDRLQRGVSYVRLPGPEIAMHPSDFKQPYDISDPEQFNERFIESRYCVGAYAFFLYVATLGHNMALGFLIYLLYAEMINLFGVVMLVLTCLPLYLGAFSVWRYNIGCVFVRFNRQAQLVHRRDFGRLRSDVILHAAWRHAVPFIEFGMPHSLELTFPSYGQKRYKRRINMISGTFDVFDNSPYELTQRLEFIRRYMEKGLEAIQPSAYLPKSRLMKMTGFLLERENPGTHQFGEFISRGLYLFFYYPSLGPLIDWLLKRQAKKFRWPEEVERLCAPGADLSAYDTTPVTPQPGVHYRYTKERGLFFVYDEKTTQDGKDGKLIILPS